MIRKLLSRSLIEPYIHPNGNFFRLSCPARFTFPREISRLLTREYLPEFEKGGLLIAECKKTVNRSDFKIKDVVFVRNISDSPCDIYEPNPREMKRVIDHAFENGLLPLIFHTHPTKSLEILDELKLFHFQMETSGMDRRASQFFHRFPEGKLHLPEVLVICNGTHKQGLFIGIYGGSVAPLGFKIRKASLLYQWLIKQGGHFLDSIETPGEALLAVGGALVAGKMISDNPVKSRRFFKDAYELLSPLVYASVQENQYFGLTYASELKINLPKQIICADNSIS